MLPEQAKRLAKLNEWYSYRHIDNTMLCPCGRVFCDEDDYDSGGSDSGVCCPDCGNENFKSIREVCAIKKETSWIKGVFVGVALVMGTTIATIWLITR